MENTRKLLVIDDEGQFAEIIGVVLDSEYRVASATTAEEGLRMARSWEPDAIVLDCGLPDMDGFEVCRLLRKDNVLRSIPVIHLSGANHPGQAEDSAASGASAFLGKPVNMDRLQDLLAKLTGGIPEVG